jgi:hypothetical protein
MLPFSPSFGNLSVVAALAAAGCRSSERASEPAPPPSASSSSKASTAMRTYELPFAPVNPRPKIKVSIQLPSSWTDQIDEYGSPKFSVPGLKAPNLGLVVIQTEDGEPAARIEQAFKWQYDADEHAVREQYPDGRLWASHAYGAITHARIFVPSPHSVVMGVALLRDATESQLAEVKATFETIKVVAQ